MLLDEGENFLKIAKQHFGVANLKSSVSLKHRCVSLQMSTLSKIALPCSMGSMFFLTCLCAFLTAMFIAICIEASACMSSVSCFLNEGAAPRTAGIVLAAVIVVVVVVVVVVAAPAAAAAAAAVSVVAVVEAVVVAAVVIGMVSGRSSGSCGSSRSSSEGLPWRVSLIFQRGSRPSSRVLEIGLYGLHDATMDPMKKNIKQKD